MHITAERLCHCVHPKTLKPTRFVSFVLPPQTVADIVRTCLGPRAMLKMLMDPMGGIVMTSDGNAILREVGSLVLCTKLLFEVLANRVLFVVMRHQQDLDHLTCKGSNTATPIYLTQATVPHSAASSSH
jgi:hypothetical protein